jgi:arsenate reductase (glutaredoxin)
LRPPTVSPTLTGSGVEVYGLPHCTTCQRALQHLRDRGVSISRFRDVKAEPLQRSEVEELATKVGSPEKLFSRRAMKYRQMGLHERPLMEEDLLRLMTEEYTLVTRPVVVCGDRASAGFGAKRLDMLITSEIDEPSDPSEVIDGANPRK